MHIAISTVDDGAEPGFAGLRLAAISLPEPIALASERPSLCRAAIAMSLLADVTIGSIANLGPAPLQATRTPRLIRRSDPEFLCLAVPITGSVTLQQRRAEVVVHPGQLAVYDTSHPYAGIVSGGEPGTTALVLGVPRTQLASRYGRLPDAAGTALRTAPALVDLVTVCLTRVAADARRYTPADAVSVSTVVTDLFATVLAAARDGAPAVPADGRDRVLLLQVKAFIDRHLADPELTPTSVAAAHHVSVRTLYRLFEERGQSVAGWIRQRRLERCRDDLVNPLLRTEPVYALAARWGFADGAQLNRAFRRAFGLPPDTYRRLRGPSGRAPDRLSTMDPDRGVPAGKDNSSADDR